MQPSRCRHCARRPQLSFGFEAIGFWMTRSWTGDVPIWPRPYRGGFELSAVSRYRIVGTTQGGADLYQLEPYADRWRFSPGISDGSPYWWPLEHEFLGFGYEGTEEPRINGFGWVSGRRYSHAVKVPAWFVCAVFLLLPAAWLAGRWRRWRRARAGPAAVCRRCGYDLRARPDRCPECGHVPEKEGEKP